MTTSPYDSLPSGNNNISPNNANPPVRNTAQDFSHNTPDKTDEKAHSGFTPEYMEVPSGRATAMPAKNTAVPNSAQSVPSAEQSVPNIAHSEPQTTQAAQTKQRSPHSEQAISDSAQSVQSSADTLEYIEVTADELEAMSEENTTAPSSEQTVPNSAHNGSDSAHTTNTGNLNRSETDTSHHTSSNLSQQEYVSLNTVNSEPEAVQISPNSAHLEQKVAQSVSNTARSVPNAEQTVPYFAHHQSPTDVASPSTKSVKSTSPTKSTIPAKSARSASPTKGTTKSTKPAKTIPLTAPPQYSHMNIKNLQGCYEYILPFEEPMLVPDTMPDMQKVLFAEGRVEPEQPGKLNYDSNDFLAGNITAYTVYKPIPTQHSELAGPAAYTDTPVDVVRSILPFKTDKCWTNADGDTFRVSMSLRNISAEMVNERKFIVKGEILIKMTGISTCELKLFKGTSDDNLITAKDSITVTVLGYETSDTIEISQNITAKEENGTPVRILKTSTNIVEAHRQITSGKLVINASIHSQILYVGEKEDGEKKLCCLDNKTDFTQFIAASDTTDPELVKLTFNDNLKVTAEGADKLLLQGNVTTLVQAYTNKSIDMTCDAYHKQKDLNFDVEAQELNSVAETVNGEISAREVATLSDSDKKPAALLCGSCRIVSIEGRAEKSRIVIDGTMHVKILALDDEDMPLVIEHTVPVRGALATSADTGYVKGSCTCAASIADAAQPASVCIDAAVKEFWFSEINSRQIEINTGLTITVWLENTKSFCTIENLCFAETENSSKRITMAVYVVGSGDTLWSVAKRYKTDMESLAALNEIDPQKPLPTGAKLLIAK